MHDPVNHPAHYTAYEGLEVIDLTEAAWYIDREIKQIGGRA